MQVKHLSLDARLADADSAQIVLDVRKDMDTLEAKLMKSSKSLRPAMRQEMRTLRLSNSIMIHFCEIPLGAELRQRENNAIKEVLQGVHVVLGTMTGVSNEGPLKHMPADYFDVVVIDEAAQALEPACWIALLHAKK